MGKINVEYDNIYKKVNELEDFVNEEIVDFGNTEHNEINHLLNDMKSKSNAEIILSLSMIKAQNENYANSLKSILKFIKTSTEEMQQREKDIETVILDEKGGE